jgi:hypothetical protein
LTEKSFGIVVVVEKREEARQNTGQQCF